VRKPTSGGAYARRHVLATGSALARRQTYEVLPVDELETSATMRIAAEPPATMSL
jgi:hypothetical protein